MSWKNLMLSTSVVFMLAACGGGGGSDTASATYKTSGNAAFGTGASGSTGTTGSGSTTTTNVTSNTAGSVILTLTSNTISASQPATVTAVVKSSTGAPIAGALVQFSVSGGAGSSLATVSPSSAITDASGQAIATLTPSTGTTVGAAYVNAQAETSAGSLTAKQAFSAVATNVSLSPLVASPTSISGYNSSSITIPVVGASSTSPVTVTVSSTCASSGKASISPTTLTLTGSSGTVTYQDKGCGSSSGGASATDRINVQIAGTAQQQYVDLFVAAPVTQGIQFVSVDKSTICQKGTGCPSVANLIFKTVDQTGAPQPGLTVDFSLNNPVATLGATFGVTGSDGTVSVAVAANRTPSPLRVIAQVRGTSLQTVSNNLTISGGLPMAGTDSSNTGMTLSVSKNALLGGWASDYADLTLRLTDRWGAPAIDGTVVNLVADGGTIVPAYCMTTNGACQVKLLVSNPTPTNGRVHVVAYAYGQESFTDANGNGVYDNGEAWIDVPAAVCLDKNENFSCDAAEYIVGNINLLNAGNGQWDDGGAAFASIQNTFFFSQSDAMPRLFQYINGHCSLNDPVDNNYMTVHMAGQLSASITFCVVDGNTSADVRGGNPLPSGTSLSVASVANTAITIDRNPVSLGASGPTVHTLTVQNVSAGGAALPDSSTSLTATFPAPGYPSSPGSTLPSPITLTQKIFIKSP